MSKAIERCTSCVLPATFPNITFNSEGLCNYCQKALSPSAMALEQERLRGRMEKVIEENKGQGKYDCIVAFSGGKDSSYVLMRLVEQYQLECLAVTVDNGFISEQAVKNCYAVTGALGVDFMLFRPAQDFMMRMYRVSATTGGVQTPASIKRASAICHSCINLINNYMIQLAVQHETPMIAGGYIGGQVPKNSAVLDLDLSHLERMKAPMRPKYNALFGPASNRFFFIRSRLLRQRQKKRIIIINPMLTLKVSEAEIIKAISTLGWVRTKDTGQNSTNCRLNNLGIAIHHKKHGFHPYVFEIAEQVRHGLMSREEGLDKIGEVPDFSDMHSQMEKVGITINDI